MRLLALFMAPMALADERAIGARLYNASIAKAFAALAKLSYCGPSSGALLPSGKAEVLPGIVGAACGTFCEAAGFEVDGTRLVRHAYPTPQGEEEDADFALVVKLRGSGRPADCAVAFRGTWTRANYMADLSFEGVDFAMPSCPEGCQVVKGPGRMISDMKEGIVEAMGKLGCPRGSSVAFTGHSLGGQLANIAMFAFQDELGYDVRLSYTFEQSRPFNAKAAEVFETLFKREVSFFRVTNTNDEVPTFPGSMVSPGFQVWYYGLLDGEKYELCGSRAGCGIEGLAKGELCPLMGGKKGCGTGAPFSGPHCRHPLAPALSFCNMAGNNRPGFKDAYYRTCRDGQPMSAKEELPTVEPQVWPGDVVLPLASDSRCFRRDTAASPMGLLGHAGSVEADARSCQLRCNATAYCELFTFRPATGSCELTGGWGEYTAGVHGAVAGPKDCGRPAASLDASAKAALQAEFLAQLGSKAMLAGYVAQAAAAALVPLWAVSLAGIAALLAVGARVLARRRKAPAVYVAAPDVETA